MSITLTPEQETRVRQRATQLGKLVEQVIEELIDLTDLEPEPKEIPTFAEWKRSRGEEPTEKPQTGAEAVAYLEDNNLLGSYGDMSLTSEEMVRKLREEANRPRYAGY